MGRTTFRQAKKSTLEFRAKRELYHPRAVAARRQLASQVLEATDCVRRYVVRMVEGIEEVGRKPDVKPLLDLEVLVDRQVVIPGARADEIHARVGVVEPTERGIVA